MIGGRDVSSDEVINTLSTWYEKESWWKQVLPLMITRWVYPTIISLDNFLLVTGGVTEGDSTLLNTTDVLDLTTMEWNTPAGLNLPYHCGDITLPFVESTSTWWVGLSHINKLIHLMLKKQQNWNTTPNCMPGEQNGWMSKTSTSHNHHLLPSKNRSTLFGAKYLTLLPLITVYLNILQQLAPVPQNKTRCQRTFLFTMRASVTGHIWGSWQVDAIPIAQYHQRTQLCLRSLMEVLVLWQTSLKEVEAHALVLLTCTAHVTPFNR